MAEKTADDKSRKQKKTPVVEWIFAAAGLILVIAAIGTTLYRAVTETVSPPILEISVDKIEPATNGYLIEFRITNTGNQTAAGLTIEGTLKKGQETEEMSTITLTYAPANSVRQGGLFFTKNPNEFELQIRPLGYEKP